MRDFAGVVRRVAVCEYGLRMIMCSRQRTMITAKAVMNSLPDDAAGAGPLAVLSRFRADFHACLTARGDELFELADAVLCADGPVRDLAGLSLAPEHRRGHGALYDAVNQGRVEIGRLRPVAGRAAVTAGRRWPAGAGRRCQQLAAARRGDQPGAAVLPRLWPRQGAGADDPGLAVLGHRGAGTWPHVVDRGAGRGAAGP